MIVSATIVLIAASSHDIPRNQANTTHVTSAARLPLAKIISLNFLSILEFSVTMLRQSSSLFCGPDSSSALKHRALKTPQREKWDTQPGLKPGVRAHRPPA